MQLKKYIYKIFYGKEILLKPFKLFKKDYVFRMNFIYQYFCNHQKVDGKIILLESSHGEKIGGNPYALFKEMLSNDEFKKHTFVWVLNKRDPFYEKYIRNIKNVKIVKRSSLNYLKYLAIAKYLINDTTFHFNFNKRPEQIYINTWHGTPVKTLGKDVKGAIGQHQNAVRNFLHADYLVQPNEFTTKIINKSHDLEGLFSGQNIEVGYPRVDLTINAHKIEVKSFLEETLGRKLDKKIVLYAPTWRGELSSIKNLNEELLHHVKLIQDSLPDDYLLLLKVHNLSYKFIKDESELENICIPNWFETNELLAIVDVLITDYSSIFFDFLHTKRPVLLFTYDYEKYKKDRGMYLELNEVTGDVYKSIEELTCNLQDIEKLNINNNYISSIKIYCSHDDGAASKRVLEKIKTPEINDKVSNKTKIVMYAGSMVTNGVTTSVLNLLSNLDYNKFDVTLLHGSKISQDIEKNILKLPNEVRVLYRSGTFNLGLIEFYLNHLISTYSFKYKFLEKYFPEKLYCRELKRLTGTEEFDIAIDYCGYSPMWAAIIASSNTKKKVIYLHSEMKTDAEKRSESNIKVNTNFDIIFNLYNRFDKLISVSEDVHIINKLNFRKFAEEEKFAFVSNPLDYEKVIELAKDVEVYNLNDESYLVLENNEQFGKKIFSLIRMPNEHQINFVTLGRLANEKDQQKLIRAFKQINEKYKNTKLYIIGDGYLKSELIALTKQLELEDSIIFTGNMSNPFALLKKCDCFVLSSNYEGQGLVILESLILGKSVISTNVVGPRGILKDGYGSLVENSVEGLVLGMEQIINGDFSAKLLDYEKYNLNAMDRFYNEVINIKK